MAHTNGDVLAKLQTKITTALARKGLREHTRVTYEILELVVMYMQDDHPKTNVMWSVFRPMAWLFVVFIVAFIGALATGRLSIVLAAAGP